MLTTREYGDARGSTNLTCKTQESYAVGDPVYYRGDRYWVEFVPMSFTESVHIRISDTRIDPTPGRLPAVKRSSFCVPVDLVTRAVQKGRRVVTVAEANRENRAKSGVTDVGDRIAELLRGKTLDEAYTVAARFLRAPEDELRSKYSHLNNGQQRMNLGNRMRAWEKKHG